MTQQSLLIIVHQGRKERKLPIISWHMPLSMRKACLLNGRPTWRCRTTPTYISRAITTASTVAIF